MRTDSFRVADEALTDVRDLIANDFGERLHAREAEHLRAARKGAQEAHEAIRPTYVVEDAGRDRSVPHRGPVQALPPDLAAVRGVADEPGAVPADRGGDQGGRGRRFPRRAGSSEFDGFTALLGHALREGRADPAAPGRRGPARAQRPRERAAFHRAAAALHGGDAGEGAREATASGGPARTRRSSRPSRSAATSATRSGSSSRPSSARSSTTSW